MAGQKRNNVVKAAEKLLVKERDSNCYFDFNLWQGVWGYPFPASLPSYFDPWYKKDPFICTEYLDLRGYHLVSLAPPLVISQRFRDDFRHLREEFRESEREGQDGWSQISGWEK